MRFANHTDTPPAHTHSRPKIASNEAADFHLALTAARAGIVLRLFVTDIAVLEVVTLIIGTTIEMPRLGLAAAVRVVVIIIVPGHYFLLCTRNSNHVQDVGMRLRLPTLQHIDQGEGVLERTAIIKGDQPAISSADFLDASKSLDDLEDS
jgi:hypothetical protein